MPDPLDYAWGDAQSQYALTCAVEGDCVFDIVQKYSSTLGDRLKALASKTPGVMKSATRGRYFGMVPPKVQTSWLAALISREQLWPSELTREEEALLRMAARSFSAIGKSLPASVDHPANREDSIKALKDFAELYEKAVAMPMWKAYDQAGKKAAREIAPICQAQFQEDCTLKEAEAIFKGDLQRGLKVKSLDMAPTAQDLLKSLLAWIKL